jgi:glycosyltransferase involved in cell wall biosynthesis
MSTVTSVRQDKQLFLAGLVREHLTSLDEVLGEIVEGGAPLTAREARLLADAAKARLAPVEHALRYDSPSISERVVAVARRTKRRIASWFGPRIGLLYHYPPKPIQLPASYFEQTFPEPPPTISIVTPSFAQGRFLERTLCSVLTQGYPALEYYVQDGGSTDESIEILRRYERELNGWATASDDGQADAINRAFSNTTGEIMGWLNSDDLLLPGALAFVARYFTEHPDVDVIYGNRLMIDEDDGQIGAWILPRHDNDVLALADYVPQETLFWRRHIWEASGSSLDPSFSYALDWDLLLRFQAAGARMAHLPCFLGAFRVHDQQKTSASRLLGLDEMSRLRERVNGRVVTPEEVLRRLRPYFLRHRITHAWHRAMDRVPLRRETFRPRVSLEPTRSSMADEKIVAAPPVERTDSVAETGPTGNAGSPHDAAVR